MTVKQISVFVENKAGKLAELTEKMTEYQSDAQTLTEGLTEVMNG